MKRSHGPGQVCTDQLARRWSRIGMAGFGFFLVKGLLWLLAPVLYAVIR